MAMTVLMKQTRQGDAGAVLSAGSTYTVTEKLGAELVGVGFATDVTSALQTGRGVQVMAEINGVTGGIRSSAGASNLRNESLSPAGRNLILLGDSLSSNHTTGVTYPALALSGRGWWNWYNFFSGHRLTLVRNAGVSGNTIAQVAARISTDVAPYYPDVVSYCCGTNDVITSRTASQMITDWLVGAVALKQLGCLVHCFTIPPITSTYAGWSSSWPTQVIEFNNFVKAYCERTKGFYCTDMFGALVDYSSASASPLANVCGSADMHLTNYGAYLVGSLMNTECASIYPSRTSSVSCVADAYGSSTQTGNYYNNSLFTVDSNVDGLADGLAFGQISGSPTTTNSLVARSGKGNWQQSVIVSAATGNRATIVRYGTATSISSGDYVYAECDVNITGATNLRNIGLTLQAVDGVTNPISHHLQRASTSDVALPASFSGVLRTPIIQVGANGPYAVEVDVYTEYSGVGGCTLQINGLQVRKVSPITSALY